ncbi:hypothetical protein [Burkholderia gladioli]|uniref:hypothetical protein n=1 Tax=Burkholderia gladioli TaxID=28095 RepID=UPI00163F86B4|nr:hypothetical protein [Burkholderia gladioli]
MTSPIEHFVIWYESLPLDQRQDTAVLISHCPGFELEHDDLGRDVVTERFAERVRAYKGGLREVAAVLALRSVVQTVIIDKRSSRADWKETQATLAELGEIHDSDTFRTKAAETQFRGEQWIVSCEKWNDLVAGPLSDHAIRSIFP